MKAFVGVLLGAAWICSLMAGCGREQEAVPEDEQSLESEYTIGVSMLYRSDEFYIDIENLLKREAEELGIELIVQDANCDPTVQMRHFEDFIQMDVDAIIFSACDPVTCSTAVAAANEAGIPVFTFDCDAANDEGITAEMCNDFYEEGYEAGEWAKEYIAENLNGHARVVILDYAASFLVSGQRANGFEDAVTEMEGVELVAREDGKATRTVCMELMEDLIETYNGDIDLVFAINYESGAGAISALKAADVEACVICAAWGEEPFQQLSGGDPYLKAVLLGDPRDQARILPIAKDYLDGKKIEKYNEYSYHLVTSETLDEMIDWREIIQLRD